MSSVWSRSELLEQKSLYKNALIARAVGSSYTIGTRSLTRQDLDDIRAHLKYFEGEPGALARGRGPVIVQARIPRGWRS